MLIQIKLINGEPMGRPVNIFNKTVTYSTGIEKPCAAYDDFEQSVTYHLAPGLTESDGVEADIVWQFTLSGDDDDWHDSDKRAYEVYRDFEDYSNSEKYSRQRQIWRLSPSQKVEVKEADNLMSEDEFQKKWAFPRSSFDFSNPITFTKSVEALMHLKEDERKILEELIWMWEENRFKK